MPQWWRAFQAFSRRWDVSLGSKYNNNSSHVFHIHYVSYVLQLQDFPAGGGGPEMTFIFPFRALVTPEWNSEGICLPARLLLTDYSSCL